MSRWVGLLWLLAVLALPVRAQTVEYIHTDALGSPVAVTDANRNVIERSEYEPFGTLLNRAATDGPGYTGHVMDAATGLTYMQQRYYDPGIGRFLSVDPVTADGTTGSNFNRYWYANNNPYRFTDPDGRVAIQIAEGAALGCLISSTCRRWVIRGLVVVSGIIAGKEGSDQIDRMRNEAQNAPGDDSTDAPQYPASPDDWVPPDGWTETNAGEKTGGKHRQWVDQDGRIRRRWDREGRENGKERGPHWHDLDDESGGKDHIEPDDKPKSEEPPKPENPDQVGEAS